MIGDQRIDLERPADLDLLPTSESTRAEPRAARNAKILLVEDDDGVRDYVRRVLLASGYTVVAAASPAEAARKTSPGDASPDLLVTDVVMPGVNGRSLARMLASDHPAMKVLYMSGYTSEAVVSEGVLDPSVQFLPKPFTASELRAKVRMVLGSCDGVA